jgi:hypothetical protein
MSPPEPTAIYLVKITKSVNSANITFLFTSGAFLEEANQKLQSLLALWRDRCGSRDMPSRADLAVKALRPWLGNLALIDLRSDEGATFRLCGTSLHSRFGGEMTRRTIASLDAAVAVTLQHSIERVRHTRKPARTTYKATQPGMATVFHEICAPLADDGVNIDTLLFASYPEQRK